MSNSSFFNKPKVDYSRYYLKNYFAYDKEASSASSNPFYKEELKEQKPAPASHKDKQKKKKKVKSQKRNGIFITIVILLCFLITALSADLLSGNFLSKELFAFQRANVKVSYWAVVSKGHAEKDKALPESILARQGGGASYILEEEHQYFVVYNVYLDKNSAEDVQKKNVGTFVKQLDIKKIDYKNFEESLSHRLEEIATVCEGIIAELYELSLSVEQQKANYFDSRVKIGHIKAPLLLLKQNLYNDDISKGDKDFILLQIEIILGNLDSLLASSYSSLTFLSDVRYIQISIIRVYQNLFKYYPCK